MLAFKRCFKLALWQNEMKWKHRIAVTNKFAIQII